MAPEKIRLETSLKDSREIQIDHKEAEEMVAKLKNEQHPEGPKIEAVVDFLKMFVQAIDGLNNVDDTLQLTLSLKNYGVTARVSLKTDKLGSVFHGVGKGVAQKAQS